MATVPPLWPADFSPAVLPEILIRLRARNPLVHNLTNQVVMNTTANALLALGASPVMADAREEVEEFAAQAGAVVVNIGTLSADGVDAMVAAIQSAHRRRVPVVVDPVGAGATDFRRRMIKRLLRAGPVAAVRGNASEILSLADGAGAGKGVDSVHAPEEVFETARRIAVQYGTVVVASGAIDLITDGTRAVKIENGHPLMARVTGLGCTATALAGACLAVEKDAFAALTAAMAITGVCGEQAAALAAGPGSLQVHFLDRLFALSPEELARAARVRPA